MKENAGSEFKLTTNDYRNAKYAFVPLAARGMISAHERINCPNGQLTFDFDSTGYHEAVTKEGVVFETSYQLFANAIHGSISEISLEDATLLERFLGQLLDGEGPLPFAIRGSTAMKIIRPEVIIDNKVNTLLDRAISLVQNHYPHSETLGVFRKVSDVSDLDLVLDLSFSTMQDVKNKLTNNFGLQVEFIERKATGTDISLAVVMITFPSGKQLKVDLFPFPYNNVTDGRVGTVATTRDGIFLKVFKHEVMDGVKPVFVEVNGLAKKIAHVPNGTRFPPEELYERKIPHSEVIALYLRMLAQAVQFPPTSGVDGSSLGVVGWSLYGTKHYGFDLSELVNSYRQEEKFNIEARVQQIAKDMVVLLYFHYKKNSLALFLMALVETGLIQYFPSMRTYVDLNTLFNIHRKEKAIRDRDENRIVPSEQMILVELYMSATKQLSDAIRDVISPLVHNSYPEYEPADAECAHTLLKLCTPKLPGQMVPGTFTPLAFLSSN